MRYRGRISGPLLDRIDLAVEVPTPAAEVLALGSGAIRRPQTPDLRDRVAVARERQRARQGIANARLDAAGVASRCAPIGDAQDVLARALTRLALSARGYHRVLKVARTIADLAGSDAIVAAHVAEALGYRWFDGGNRTQLIAKPPGPAR